MDSHKTMSQIRNRFIPAMLLALAFAASGNAQQFPFQLSYAQGAVTTPLGNGGILSFATSLGTTQTIQVRATYTGTGTVKIPQEAAISGSSAFTAALQPASPINLTTGQTFFFSIRFSPVTSAADAAQLAILFDETPATTVSPITLSLQGFTSAIVPSYILGDDNNVVQLTSGATIPFADTLVGQSLPVTLSFTNVGSNPGQVIKVTSTGSAFQLQNLPLFPATVLGGQSLQMKIVYKPTATGPATGTLVLDAGGTGPITVQLRGNGVAPKVSYEAGNPASAISPGGTISLPNVEVGQTSNGVVRVTNTGTASATIANLSTVGSTFALANPPQLPQTLAPNTSLVLAVTFTPSRTGVQTGTLLVNSDIFNLTGSGLGPQLTYSYVASGSTITLGGSNNSIIFSPIRITDSAQLNLDIKNTGTTTATIQNIGIGQTGTAYTILSPPTLPATLAANATLRVTIKFEPVVVGFANTTLVVDNNSFTLTGSGTAPPALPAYTISGPTGTTAPLTQPSFGLKLATPYPVALTGTLTLGNAAGSLPADPTVQFATGGRTVNFRIPANTLDATFGSLGTQVGLQTGTVAGTITITPSFATLAGNVDLTPGTPLTSQFTVAPAAPSILSLQVSNASTTGLTLVVTGFSTSRTLTALNVQFTTASGFKMPASQFAIDMKLIAAAWFQSTASQAFGGQFRVSIPFTFQVPVGQSILTGISSVSVTTSNESGTSPAAQTRVQ
jgi:hypothetical protein